MKKRVVVSLMMCFTLGIMTPVAVAKNITPIPIIKEGGPTNDYETHWAGKSIQKWIDKGIIEGYEDGTFRPDEPLTRAEFAKIMVELFGYYDTFKAKDYQDINVRKWYADYVEKISAAQIMYETDGVNFYPEANITREEALYALANSYSIHSLNYERGQMADLETYMGLNFSDRDQISEWALDAFKVFYENGYIKSDEDNCVNPQAVLTRGELAALLDNLMSDVVNQQSGIYENDVEGNLLVNQRNVLLRNMTIGGNLYLTEGIENGTVTLDNVIVKGNLIAADGVQIAYSKLKEEGRAKYFKEPNELVQKATVKGTIYRQGANYEDIETYALLTVKDLTNGKIEEPIVIYNGAYSIDLIKYHDYQITAEHTIDGQLYQDIKIIKGLNQPTELNFNLIVSFSVSMLEDELYKDRWKF